MDFKTAAPPLVLAESRGKKVPEKETAADKRKQGLIKYTADAYALKEAKAAAAAQNQKSQDSKKPRKVAADNDDKDEDDEEALMTIYEIRERNLLLKSDPVKELKKPRRRI